MSFAEGALEGFSTLADLTAQTRRNELREQQFAERKRQNRLAESQSVAQNRRAESQEQRAQEQFELNKERTNAQLQRIEAATQRLEQQNKLARATFDSNVEQSEADADRTRALANFREKKNEILARQDKGERAATALDATRGDFTDFVSSPADLFQATSIMSSVAGDEIDLPGGESSGLIPVNQSDPSQGFFVVDGRGSDGFQRATDENGEPIVMSPEQARNTFQSLRGALEQASLSAEDGGVARDRNLDRLVEARVNQNQQRALSSEDVPTVQAPERSSDEIRSEIDSADEEIASLRGQARSLLNVPDSEISTTRGSGPGPGGGVARRREQERKRDLSNLSREEVNGRLGRLEGGEGVFANSVIKRGRKLAGRRETLADRDLPRAQALEQQREARQNLAQQLDQKSSGKVEQIQELVRSADAVQEGGLTTQEAINIIDTGFPDTSLQDLDETQRKANEQFDEAINEQLEGSSAEVIDDEKNAAAVKANGTKELKAQAAVLRRRMGNQQFKKLVDTGQLQKLAVDAFEVGRNGDPNLFMAMELIDFDASSRQVGEVFDKLASKQTLNLESADRATQADITRRIAREIDKDANRSDELIAGEVFNDLQTERQTGNQPGFF